MKKFRSLLSIIMILSLLALITAAPALAYSNDNTHGNFAPDPVSIIANNFSLDPVLIIDAKTPGNFVLDPVPIIEHRIVGLRVINIEIKNDAAWEKQPFLVNDTTAYGNEPNSGKYSVGYNDHYRILAGFTGRFDGTHTGARSGRFPAGPNASLETRILERSLYVG